MENTTLINMNVPIDIKEGFKKVCKLRCMNMSHVLVNLMSKYIIEEGNKVKEDIQKIKEVELMTTKVHEDRVKRKVDHSRSNWFLDY
tara:strand:+ start:83 stop:343 length:261 start_codon:yes stop_codon:yes gene_type:complete